MTKQMYVPHENKLNLIPVRPGVFFVLWDFSNEREKRIKAGEFSENVKIRLFNQAEEICSENLFLWKKRKHQQQE